MTGSAAGVALFYALLVALALTGTALAIWLSRTDALSALGLVDPDDEDASIDRAKPEPAE